MKSASRANVASSFTVIKGAMIEETYAVFAEWDLAVRSARTSTGCAQRTSSEPGARHGFEMWRKFSTAASNRKAAIGRSSTWRRPAAASTSGSLCYFGT